MRYSDDLFRLIKSLEKSEKRYFRLSASLQGKNKKYLLLFDAVDRQEEYDETQLKEEFREEKFVQQFAVAKGYLYNLILRSLRLYHSGADVNGELRDILANIEVLHDRGLNDLALKALEKGIALASLHDRDWWLVQLLGWEEKLRPGFRASHQELERAAERRLGAVDRVRNTVEYQFLLHHISRAILDDHVRTADERDALEDILRHPLMQSPEKALSISARLYYEWIRCVYYYARNEFLPALEHSERMIALLEEKGTTLHEDFDLYLTVLGNCLTLQRQADQEEKFHATVEKVKNLEQELAQTKRLDKPRRGAHIFQTLYLYLLTFHLGRAEFGRAVALAPDIEAGLARYGRFLGGHVRFKFFHNLAYSFFALGEYHAALAYTNRIVMEKEPRQGKQTYYAARLLNLVIHYELGNIALLKSLVPSTYRYLLSRQSVHRLEQSVIAFFRKLSRVSTSSRLMEEFIELREVMEELEKDPFEQNAFRYFGYVEWLESKISGRSFAWISLERLQAGGDKGES